MKLSVVCVCKKYRAKEPNIRKRAVHRDNERESQISAKEPYMPYTQSAVYVCKRALYVRKTTQYPPKSPTCPIYREICRSAKEPYMSAKEPYMSAKEPYMPYTQRAIYVSKRALYVCKRALHFLYTASYVGPQKSPICPTKSPIYLCKRALHMSAKESCVCPQKIPIYTQNPQKSPICPTESLIHSKEPYMPIQKSPVCPFKRALYAKEPYMPDREPYALWKRRDPYTCLQKELYIYTKSAKELYIYTISAKEPDKYTKSAKEPYMPDREPYICPEEIAIHVYKKSCIHIQYPQKSPIYIRQTAQCIYNSSIYMSGRDAYSCLQKELYSYTISAKEPYIYPPNSPMWREAYSCLQKIGRGRLVCGLIFFYKFLNEPNMSEKEPYMCLQKSPVYICSPVYVRK